jgi:putative glutamine amidotransferase
MSSNRPRRVGVTYREPDKGEVYAAALRAVGAEPVLIAPPGPDSLAGLDGLVISGGTDLDPSLYGQERHPLAEEPDRERDDMELRLMREALDADLPLLGICRGLQLFNVAHGGNLIQHLDCADSHVVRGETNVHTVALVEGSKLAAIAGACRYPVNSRHHQAAGRIGEGLLVSARSAADGVIEGLERPDRRFAVAVQWHPEDRVPGDPYDTRLFEAFLRAM